MSLSRKNNWSANSTYLYWKIISQHQLRVIIPMSAKRHSAPTHISSMSRKLKSHFAVLNSFQFPLSSKEEIVVEHFQDLLAFWPFVSFQEVELPFPRIKLFSSGESFCWILQSLLLRQEDTEEVLKDSNFSTSSHNHVIFMVSD